MLEAIGRHTVNFYHTCTLRCQNYIRDIPSLYIKVKEISRTESTQLISTIKQLALSILINVVPSLPFAYFFPGPFFLSGTLAFVFYEPMHRIISDVSRIFEPVDREKEKHFFARSIAKITYVVLGGVFCILGIPYTQIILSMFCGGRLGAMINPNYWQLGKPPNQKASSAPLMINHPPLLPHN